MKYWTVILISIWITISCQQPEVFAPNTVEDSGATAEPSPDATKTPTNEPTVLALSDDEAVEFTKENCEGCHHPQNGAYRSIWTIDFDNLKKSTILSDAKIVTVYTALVKKDKNITDGKPAQMPPSISDENKPKLAKMLKWLESNSAAVFHSQVFKEVNPDQESPAIEINYQCAEKATTRQVIRRIMNDLFDREPTRDELRLVELEVLDQPVTRILQEALVDHIFNKDESFKQEIMTKSLKKFADSLAGSAGLEKFDGITNEQLIDLKDEFYQLLLNQVDSKSYKEILLTKEIFATENTMGFYKDCTQNPESNEKWFSCTLKDPRSSYFGSVSFLNSAPSNFLTINNNYKRIKTAFFMIHGEIFESAADDESGGETDPLPDCFQSSDRRGTLAGGNVAPYGSTSIPESGNFCQSCHIHQNMGAASVLFRPFSSGGLVYERQMNLEEDPSFINATGEDQVNVSGDENLPVNKEMLINLMNLRGEKTCVVENQLGSTKTVEVKNVGELIESLMKDESKIASGLARHFPRAFSNLPNTSNELIERISTSYEKNNGKLLPMIQQYFESETFSCARGAE